MHSLPWFPCLASWSLVANCRSCLSGGTHGLLCVCFCITSLYLHRQTFWSLHTGVQVVPIKSLCPMRDSIVLCKCLRAGKETDLIAICLGIKMTSLLNRVLLLSEFISMPAQSHQYNSDLRLIESCLAEPQGVYYICSVCGEDFFLCLSFPDWKMSRLMKKLLGWIKYNVGSF